MSRNFTLDVLRNKARNATLFLQVFVLIAAGFTPILLSGHVDAAQLTSRKVTISNSEPSATGVKYGFQFSWGAATPVRGVLMQFCTTALGTCTLPTGMDVSAATVDGSAGFPGGALSTTKTTASTGDCNDASGGAPTMVCLTSASATSATGTDATVTLGAITNPSLVASPNLTTVYVRVAVYGAAAFAGPPVHAGTVAAAINRQLTVSGRVQERLLFCVASVEDGGATDTTLPKTLAECAALTDTVVDLGIIDNTSITKSPVPNAPPTSQGNAKYGVAMLNTNASSGVAVTYFAEPDTTSGAAEQLRAFRVPGAACDATASTLTDQCFVSASGTGDVFTAGAERFGVNIPCIVGYNSGGNVNGLVSTTANMTANANYSGYDADTSATADCENTDPVSPGAGNKYAWNTTNAAVPLASSSTVVDNEIVKLNFAATASATTPTGAYTVRSTYIATPTF